MKEEESCLYTILIKKMLCARENKYAPGIINFDFLAWWRLCYCFSPARGILKWSTNGNSFDLKETGKPAIYYQAEFNFKRNTIITAAGDSALSLGI
jgi:hypothetical protein